MYVLDEPLDGEERSRLCGYLGALSEMAPGRTAAPEAAGLENGFVWIASPFVGHGTAMLTLDRLAEERDTLAPNEVDRAICQLLDTTESARDAGIAHGPVSYGEPTVDRGGRVVLELPGLGRALDGLSRVNPELVRDEVRSIVELGYRIAVGLPAGESPLRPSRLNRRLGRSWDLWFEQGLDPSRGFETPAEARLALPSATTEAAVVEGAGLRFLGRRKRAEVDQSPTA